jgi:hypothetical protein
MERDSCLIDPKSNEIVMEQNCRPQSIAISINFIRTLLVASDRTARQGRYPLPQKT